MKPSPSSARVQLLPQVGVPEDRSAGLATPKRKFSPARAVQSLFGDLKRSKSGAVQGGAASSATSSATGLSGSRLSQCLQRVIRLAFPASKAQAEIQQFPHEVSRLMQKQIEEGGGAWSALDLLSNLSESMEQKQGFVLLRDASEPSLGEAFNKALTQAGGQIKLDEHCTLIALSGPLNKLQETGVTQWQAMVFDDRLGFEVPVPLTECVLPHAAQATSDDPHLAQKLMTGKKVMDAHLEEVHSAFADSPHNPPVLCPSNPRLAQLLTAQEECLSRYYRRLHTSNDRFEWLCFMESVLGEPQFGQSAYRGEEGCGVEAFFTHLPKVECRESPTFSLGGHANLAPNQDNYADYIRAYKRHLPAQPQPVQKTAPQRVASPSSSSASSTGASSSAAAAQAGPSRPNPWAQRANGMAYKESSRQMQCGLNAFNGLMQGPALSAGELVRYEVQRHARVGELLGLPPHQAKGLMHPAVIDQLTAQGRATATKSMFGAGLDPVLEQSHADQWKALVNSTPQARGKNWVDDGAALRAIDRIEISADQWLSAHRGLDMEGFKQLINERVAQAPQNMLGMQLPQQFALSQVNPQSAPQLAQHHSQQAAAWLASGSVQAPKDYPLVVRCGGSGQDAGHYYTVVPDGQGNWLSLNGDGTSHDGQQACRVWAQQGGLGDAFIAHGVQQVIHPQL